MKSIAMHNASLERIAAFTTRYPDACFHAVDMPYRLSSPATQDPANVKLWADAEGELLGFGLLQFPFSSLDWAVRPGNEQLQQEIVAWGVARLERVAAQQSGGLGFLLDSRSDDDWVAQQHGFQLDDWTIRHMALQFEQVPSTPEVPTGFQIRPLRGESEAEAYVNLHRAAFQSRNMTNDWRRRTINHPRYAPQLDLVAENANGQLAAFCIGWLGEINGSRVGQIEPMGVLPEYQGQGLGRAILLESLGRFYKHGVKRLFIDAESNNSASQHLYEAVGFQEQSCIYKYYRHF
jgi:mycothiol synthase